MPNTNITYKDFLRFKSQWLIKNSNLDLIEDYLIKHVPIHQLYANISSNNSESISLFEKNSYTKVGLKKDWIYYNNMFCDELLYQKIIKK